MYPWHILYSCLTRQQRWIVWTLHLLLYEYKSAIGDKEEYVVRRHILVRDILLDDAEVDVVRPWHDDGGTDRLCIFEFQNIKIVSKYCRIK